MDQGSGLAWEKRSISPALSWEDDDTILAGDSMLKLDLG